MTERLQVRAVDGIVNVSLQGKTSTFISIEAILRAVWLARREKTRCVLFDIREVEPDEYHTRVVKLAAEGPRMGISSYRIAIVGLVGDPRLRFMEDVGINRGVQVKSFTDWDAGRDWLLAGACRRVPQDQPTAESPRP